MGRFYGWNGCPVVSVDPEEGCPLTGTMCNGGGGRTDYHMHCEPPRRRWSTVAPLLTLRPTGGVSGAGLRNSRVGSEVNKFDDTNPKDTNPRDTNPKDTESRFP